jgi:hypothetical protein
MTLQVGDKVVVFNSGTDYARAVKWTAPQVGDSVTVITLSDGTKLAMPKLELTTGQYVFVIPTWPGGFVIGDQPIWQLLPLGAAVFSLTRIIDCWSVADDDREWDEGFSLSGMLLIIITGKNRGIRYLISSYQEDVYALTLESLFPLSDYSDYIESKETGTSSPGTVTITKETYGSIYCHSSWLNTASGRLSSPSEVTISGAGEVSIQFRIAKWGDISEQARVYIPGTAAVDLNNFCVSAGSVLSEAELIQYGLTSSNLVNPSYPNYDTHTWAVPTYFSGIISLYGHSTNDMRSWINFEFGPLKFKETDCITDGLAPGDNYIIYDPTTKRLIFNDASKTILSSAYWRDIVVAGEEISTAPVEYIWDGQGQVYLSQSKSTRSTIMFDDQLMVDSVNGTTTRTLGYADHVSESITYSGVIVQRELVNITHILRAGKNMVTLTVKDTTGTKVGFPTPVYILRSL